MPSARLAAALLAGALLAGSCADDHPGGSAAESTTSTAPASAPPSALPLSAGVDVTLQQYRADEVAQQIGIQMTNRTDAVVEVATARIDWSGLARIEPTAVDYPVAPGVTVDVKVEYGDAVCSDPPQVTETVPPDPIVVEVVSAAGETLRWPVDDIRGVLARVHGLDCRRQAVEHLVAVEIGRTWMPNAAGDAVTGELILTRRNAAGPATLTGISGSVLLNVDVAPGAATELTGDALTIPIVVTSANRCEPHALADSKKTYEFQVTLEVDGVGASIAVGPDPADEPTVFEPVNVTCGLG
jgi:hypothetical protein